MNTNIRAQYSPLHSEVLTNVEGHTWLPKTVNLMGTQTNINLLVPNEEIALEEA